MAREKRCLRRECKNVALVQITMESTWTFERFVCPTCARVYTVPTVAGKMAQVAPLGMLGVIIAGVCCNELDAVIEHLSGEMLS